ILDQPEFSRDLVVAHQPSTDRYQLFPGRNQLLDQLNHRAPGLPVLPAIRADELIARGAATGANAGQAYLLLARERTTCSNSSNLSSRSADFLLSLSICPAWSSTL